LVLTTLFALFLGVSGAAAPVGLAANPPNTKVAGIDVDATTIPQLQQLMNSHRINAVNLMNFYLHRIRQLNSVLNAVITVSPTAHADAVAADAARRGGDHRPLLGVPIIVKDNVDTTGMPTTAGSWALAGSTPADAFIDYTQFLNDHALQGKRIGVWRAGTYDPKLVGSVVEPILNNVIAALKSQGATVVDPTDIDLSATVNEFPALLCEFKTDIATYLHTYVHGTNPVTHAAYAQTLADLIAFDQSHPNLEGPWNDAV